MLATEVPGLGTAWTCPLESDFWPDTVKPGMSIIPHWWKSLDVVAGELQVVLCEPAADHREHLGAGLGHRRFDVEHPGVEVDDLDGQATDAALFVAPVGERHRGVVVHLEQARAPPWRVRSLATPM